MNEKNPSAFDSRWNGASIPEEHWHFHRRLLERYGIVLLPGEFAQIVNDLKQGRALLIEWQSKRDAVYSVRLATQYERIYVLSDGKQVFTAWPPSKRLNGIRRALSLRWD